ncbi:MAG: hypothetical protein ACOH5I_03245 [Oligoflexus sp.]
MLKKSIALAFILLPLSCGQKDRTSQSQPPLTDEEDNTEVPSEKFKVAPPRDNLNDHYCLATLTADVFDNNQLLVANSGETYLLANRTDDFLILMEETSKVSPYRVKPEEFETDCDKEQIIHSGYKDWDFVVLQDWPLFDNEDLKGEPVCVLKRGELVSGAGISLLDFEGNNVLYSFSFGVMQERCGLEKAFTDQQHYYLLYDKNPLEVN